MSNNTQLSVNTSGSISAGHAALYNPIAAGDSLTALGGSSGLLPTGGDLVCEVLVAFGDATT